VKKLLPLIIILFLATQQATACCARYVAEIYPSGESLSQNPVILLDYTKELSDVLTNAEFYLMTGEGKKIDIEIIEENTASSYRQMLLQPSGLLDKGIKVSFKVENLNIDKASNANVKKDIERLIETINKTWTVSIEEDKVAPKYGKEFSGTYYDRLISSSPGVDIAFEFSYDDNVKYTFTRSIYSKKQVLIEVTDEKGYKCIIPVNNGEFHIVNGSCIKHYNLEPDTQYYFEFRLMDFSGNKSEEIKNFAVKTDISSLLRKEEIYKEIYGAKERAKGKN